MMEMEIKILFNQTKFIVSSFQLYTVHVRCSKEVLQFAILVMIADFYILNIYF